MKLSKKGVSMEYFGTDFMQFSSDTVQDSNFWDFPDTSKFPKIVNLKSLSNLWGNLFIYFLVIIIQFPFKCGEDKLC